MRTRIALFMIVAVGLSGCAGDSGAPETETSHNHDDHEHGTNQTLNETVDDGNLTGNLVPVLNVTADVVNGTAPLLVNFTLSLDDDSDNVSWVFSVDDNETLKGTEFPAAFNHTFQAGLTNVSVSVFDGEHTVTQTLSINATAGEVVLEEVGRFEGKARVALFTHRAASYAIECPGFVAGEEGAGCFWAELPSEMAGQPAVYTTTAATTRLAFWDVCDAVDGEDVGWFEEGNPLELTIPDGAGCVIAWSADTFDVGQEHDFSLVVYG